MNYTIELKDGKKIPLYFSTRVVENFCQRNGNLTVTGFHELVANNAWTFGHLVSILFCAAEYYARRNNLPIDFTEYDADDWMTELGGIHSEKAQKLLADFIITAYPQVQGMIEAVVDKKKPAKKK